MNRLIDQIQIDIRDKNILSKITYIMLSESSYYELLDDFKEEFEVEYIDIGRNPNKEDVQDYLGVPIIIQKLNKDEKYSLLTKA